MITFAVAKSFLGFIGSKIPWRWVVMASIAALLCIGASIYIHDIYTFVVWSLIAAGFSLGAFITWELACWYYVGVFDVPFDGKKPIRKK